MKQYHFKVTITAHPDMGSSKKNEHAKAHMVTVTKLATACTAQRAIDDVAIYVSEMYSGMGLAPLCVVTEARADNVGEA